MDSEVISTHLTAKLKHELKFEAVGREGKNYS